VARLRLTNQDPAFFVRSANLATCSNNHYAFTSHKFARAGYEHDGHLAKIDASHAAWWLSFSGKGNETEVKKRSL
jgi:hypothetical protein